MSTSSETYANKSQTKDLFIFRNNRQEKQKSFCHQH